MRRSGLAFLVSCIVVVAGSPAAADNDADHQKASAAFRAARADITAGNCAAAISKLEESLSYEPSVGAHLSIADCYEQVDLVAAWRELQEAADLAASKGDERASVARDRALGLEPRLSMLRFVYAPAPADPSGLEVRVDGNVVRPYLLRRGTLATTPGVHDVEVSTPHKKTWRGHVAAHSAGTSVEVDVALEDESAPAPVAAAAPTPEQAPTTAVVTSSLATAPESPSSWNGQKTVALVTGGAGLAGLVVGTIFGIEALGHASDLRNACNGDIHHCTAPQDSASVTQPRDAAHSAATGSTIAFIAGGVAVAAGIVLYVTAPSSTHHVEVGASAAPGAAGMSLLGDFD
jgi:hypothetical protein